VQEATACWVGAAAALVGVGKTALVVGSGCDADAL